MTLRTLHEIRHQQLDESRQEHLKTQAVLNDRVRVLEEALLPMYREFMKMPTHWRDDLKVGMVLTVGHFRRLAAALYPGGNPQ